MAEDGADSPELFLSDSNLRLDSLERTDIVSDQEQSYTPREVHFEDSQSDDQMDQTCLKELNRDDEMDETFLKEPNTDHEMDETSFREPNADQGENLCAGTSEQNIRITEGLDEAAVNSEVNEIPDSKINQTETTTTTTDLKNKNFGTNLKNKTSKPINVRRYRKGINKRLRPRNNSKFILPKNFVDKWEQKIVVNLNKDEYELDEDFRDTSVQKTFEGCTPKEDESYMKIGACGGYQETEIENLQQTSTVNSCTEENTKTRQCQGELNQRSSHTVPFKKLPDDKFLQTYARKMNHNDNFPWRIPNNVQPVSGELNQRSSHTVPFNKLPDDKFLQPYARKMNHNDNFLWRIPNNVQPVSGQFQKELNQIGACGGWSLSNANNYDQETEIKNLQQTSTVNSCTEENTKTNSNIEDVLTFDIINSSFERELNQNSKDSLDQNNNLPMWSSNNVPPVSGQCQGESNHTHSGHENNWSNNCGTSSDNFLLRNYQFKFGNTEILDGSYDTNSS